MQGYLSPQTKQCYKNSSSASPSSFLHLVHHIDGLETRFNSKRRLSLITMKYTSTVDTKELFISKFQLWMKREIVRDSYLTSQLRGHFQLQYRKISMLHVSHALMYLHECMYVNTFIFACIPTQCSTDHAIACAELYWAGT